jgi:Icc-related predicted phosphoesterase
MKMFLSDFRHISGFEPWVYDRHEASLRFLDKELTASDILVTHQFPFSRSVSSEFLKSPMNCFFHAGRQAEAIVVEREPFLAIHGHTHTSFDYYAGKTRVVCNPHGYPRENANFDFAKVIDV